MKTLLPRLTVAGLFTAMWVTTSAYTTLPTGSFRPTEAAPGGKSTTTLEPSQHYPGPMNDGIAVVTAGAVTTGQFFTIGSGPTRPEMELGGYASTDFTEFDQLR